MKRPAVEQGVKRCMEPGSERRREIGGVGLTQRRRREGRKGAISDGGNEVSHFVRAEDEEGLARISRCQGTRRILSGVTKRPRLTFPNGRPSLRAGTCFRGVKADVLHRQLKLRGHWVGLLVAARTCP
jgi:hypothetical protein